MNNIIKYTDNFDGTSCNFSYLSPNILGGSFSENFGIAGRGKIVLLKYYDNILKPLKEIYFEKGINCFKFNRISDNIIHLGDTEGKLITIKIDYNNLKEEISLIKIFQSEITYLNTGKISKNLLLSTSTDNTAKIIDINNNKILLNISNYSKKGFTSNSIDYKTPNLISLSTNDGTVLFFDIRNPTKPIKCMIFNNPILSIDFNQFNSNFSIGESNGIIDIYDLRNDKNIPVTVLNGHHLAVKQLKFSPFNQNILCSCGYDMNIYLWDIKFSLPVKSYKHHSEFVTGIDFSNFNPNILSSISFDKSLDIFNINDI
jgi:peroxin-7